MKNRLPSADLLLLAFSMSKGGVSRGTARTMIEGLGHGSVIRKNGKLMSVSLGSKVRVVPFGKFNSLAMNIPWGDVSTAWFSTGIPNIEVYMGVKPALVRMAKIGNFLGPLLRIRAIKNLLRAFVDQKSPGPSSQKRDEGRSFLWARASNASGKIVESTLECMSGYNLTAQASVLIAQKILAGNFKPGYQTPATAYGEDLVMELEGTKRVDT
jgi:short subunit dehydrogenase-like uncharacterized protein